MAGLYQGTHFVHGRLQCPESNSRDVAAKAIKSRPSIKSVRHTAKTFAGRVTYTLTDAERDYIDTLSEVLHIAASDVVAIAVSKYGNEVFESAMNTLQIDSANAPMSLDQLKEAADRAVERYEKAKNIKKKWYSILDRKNRMQGLTGGQENLRRAKGGKKRAKEKGQDPTPKPGGES